MRHHTRLCLEAGDFYFIPAVWVALAQRCKKPCEPGLAGLNDFCHGVSPLVNDGVFSDNHVALK
jgi:hypothetical protein